MLGLYAFSKIGGDGCRTIAAVSAVLDPDLLSIGGGGPVGDILLEPARYNYQRFLEGSAYREPFQDRRRHRRPRRRPHRCRQPGSALTMPLRQRRALV